MSDKELQEYNAFLEQKKQTRIESGFTIEESELNPMLFPFQKNTLKLLLRTTSIVSMIKKETSTNLSCFCGL